MAKTASFALRLDEELKNKAQEALNEIGLPMSLAVELFLREVVDKKKLPFTLGPEEEDGDPQRERRERDFWKSFILWYFKAWPHFQSEEMRQKALDDFGFDEHREGAGRRASAYINGDTGGYPDRMTPEQLEASIDLGGTTSLLLEAKELIYWALDMDSVFVPSLSAQYAAESDTWQYQHLKKQRRPAEGDDWPVADGVVGARYFGVDECEE